MAKKTGTKKMKRWVGSGSKNSRHPQLNGETVDLYQPFSNGLQYPGDHNGPESEWGGCQCSLEIIVVDKKTGDVGPDVEKFDYGVSPFKPAPEVVPSAPAPAASGMTEAEKAKLKKELRDIIAQQSHGLGPKLIARRDEIIVKLREAEFRKLTEFKPLEKVKGFVPTLRELAKPDKLTKDLWEKQSKGQGGVATMNRGLRKGSQPGKLAKKLDDYTASSEVTESGVVYRGAQFDMAFLEKLGQGEVFEDLGFMSVSTDLNVARLSQAEKALAHATEGRAGLQDVLFKIELPPGQALGVISKSEWVLPRGMQFRVVGREYAKGEWQVALRAEKIKGVEIAPSEISVKPLEDQLAKMGDLVEYQGKPYRAIGIRSSWEYDKAGNGIQKDYLSIGIDDGSYVIDHDVLVQELKVLERARPWEERAPKTVADLTTGDEALYYVKEEDVWDRVHIYGVSKNGKLYIESSQGGLVDARYVSPNELKMIEVPTLDEGQIILYQGHPYEVVAAREESYEIVKLGDKLEESEISIFKNDTRIVGLSQEQQEAWLRRATEEQLEKNIGESLNFQFGRSFLSKTETGDDAFQEVEAWAKEKYAGWEKKLTRPQREAMEQYAGDGYEMINGYLRGTLDMETLSAEDLAQVKKWVKDLDEAFAKATVPEDITVYRVGSIDVPGLQVGDVYVDQGITSTALDANYSTFVLESRDAGMAVVRIQVPAGTRAAPISFWKGGKLEVGSESELTLSANTRFQYLGVDADGIQVVKVINSDADLLDMATRKKFVAKPGKKLSDKEVDDLDLMTPLEPQEIDFSMGEFVGAQDSPVNAYLNHVMPKDIDPRKADLIDKYIGAKREYRGVGNIQIKVAGEIRGKVALTDDELLTQLEWDKLLAESPAIGRPMTVYRGVGDWEGFSDANGGLKVGDVFTDRAMSSTTGNREFADYFSRVRNGGDTGNTAIFEIELSAEQRALWTQRYYEKPIQEALNAQELVLPRGTQYRIERITKDSKGQTIVKITVDPVAKPDDLFDLWWSPRKGAVDENGEPFLVGDVVEYAPDGLVAWTGRITEVNRATGRVIMKVGSNTLGGEMEWLVRREGWKRAPEDKARSAAAKKEIEKLLEKQGEVEASKRLEFRQKFGDALGLPDIPPDLPVLPRTEVSLDGPVVTAQEFNEWRGLVRNKPSYVDTMELDHLEKLIRYAKQNPTKAKKELEFRGLLQEAYDARKANLARPPHVLDAEYAARNAPKQIRQEKVFGRDFTSTTPGELAFSSPKAQAWAKDAFDEWGATLTEVEKGSIEAYVGSTKTYRSINQALRTGTKPSQEIQSAIDNLTSALERVALKEDLTVYRRGYLPENLAPGDVFLDEGFVSTTLDGQLVVKGGQLGGKAGKGEPFRILVPKGTQAGLTDVVVAFEDRAVIFDYEAEILLQRGLQYEYLGVVDGMPTVRVVAQKVAKPVTKVVETPRATYANYSEVQKEFAPHLNSLTTPQLQAIDEYISSEAFSLNASLRGLGKPPSEFSDLVKRLDESMKPLERDLKSYRGFDQTYEEIFGRPPKVGDLFEDEAFTSTTLVEKTAKDFALDGHGLMIEIDTPAGIRALVTPGSEAEVLLGRGTKFKVEKILKDRVVVKVVDQEVPSLKKVAETAKKVVKTPEPQPAPPLHEVLKVSPNVKPAAQEFYDTITSSGQRLPKEFKTNRIKVTGDTAEGTEINGWYDAEYHKMGINTTRSVEDQLATITHEMGHALDYHWSGAKGTFANAAKSYLSTDAAGKEFLDAALSSERIQVFIKERDSFIKEANALLKKKTLTEVEKEDLRRLIFLQGEGAYTYLLDAKEVWARAYTQYVAETSGNEALLAEVRSRAKKEFGDQWMEEDFIHIKQAVENVLKRQGILEGLPEPIKGLKIAKAPPAPLELNLATVEEQRLFQVDVINEGEAKALKKRSTEELQKLKRGFELKWDILFEPPRGSGLDPRDGPYYELVVNELKRRGAKK